MEYDVTDEYKRSINEDWKFLLGDPEGAEKTGYCDRTWEHIDLPHDWVIHQPFERGESTGWTKEMMQGYFVWKSTGWYRKEFILEDLRGKEVFLYFGCAYRNAVIYVNGIKAASHAYGYTSFEICVSRFIREGRNLLAVRLDHGSSIPDRWYSGAGLFRGISLRVVPKLHFTTWGPGVRADVQEDGRALVKVSAEIANTAAEGGNSALFIKVFDPRGKEICGREIPFQFLPESKTPVESCFDVANPLLWSDREPRLYEIAASIGGENAPSVKVKFGVRSVKMIAKKGFFVNGKNIKLKGVCLHHDCGILGAAFYRDAWRRRLLILKGLGCNAIRTSHNPQADEFLDLCDELGFYVMDECFDKWKSLSYGEIFEANWRQDLNDFIGRDRNHPSVFCWSVGNEVEGQGGPGMLETGKMLCDYVRTLDDRPVTVALSPHVTDRSQRDMVGAPPEKHVEITNRVAEFVDVLGLNYHEPWYPWYTAAIDKPIIGTECYEYYSATLWSYEDFDRKNPWRYVLEDDNVLGQFIWAGVDYLGEANWPSRGWAGSSLDICGFHKDQTWLRKSYWSEEPVAHICFYDNTAANNYARGRWNFPYTVSHLNLDHMNRRVVNAAIYTNCDEVELRLNGKRIGRRSLKDFENNIIEWPFDYARGELKLIGFRGGKEVVVNEIKTAGPPAVLSLKADKADLEPGALAHIEISVTDEAGVLSPVKDTLLGFSLEGDGEIMGASSPDLNNSLGYDLPRVYTSLGRALAIIKAGASAGKLVFSAYGEELKTGRLTFTVSG
jgi:beta-galactosidase